eukprot:TRINITY_DN9900_c0_g1_i1.p2 TRINITY_DN9900_c0_g1~~TRINITY_DN9900_c0_g1_i1.p2  ORF type:complete len:196 (+),score=17.92 TRINITY_DN9900_c0_g1_i1:390-977(+)
MLALTTSLRHDHHPNVFLGDACFEISVDPNYGSGLELRQFEADTRVFKLALTPIRFYFFQLGAAAVTAPHPLLRHVRLLRLEFDSDVYQKIMNNDNCIEQLKHIVRLCPQAMVAHSNACQDHRIAQYFLAQTNCQHMPSLSEYGMLIKDEYVRQRYAALFYICLATTVIVNGIAPRTISQCLMRAFLLAPPYADP